MESPFSDLLCSGFSPDAHPVVRLRFDIQVSIQVHTTTLAKRLQLRSAILAPAFTQQNHFIMISIRERFAFVTGPPKTTNGTLKLFKISVHFIENDALLVAYTFG